ncbi:hypothetical protein [Dyadobacter sp. 676]|uniref:DUF4384 domain-containing protein n=1 Tax=Dyadobacter sp. 676 TaxID=3088362 RepID=A0AAU8FJG0_9BACT
MKRLLMVLIFVLPLRCSFGQGLSAYYRVRAAERAKQVLKDFESAFGLLTNPYVTDTGEREEAEYRMQANLRPDARFENDLLPDNKGTKTIDFDEYKRIAFIGYQKSGLTCHFDWEEAEFRAVPEGYLVSFYGKKTLFGRYQGNKPLELKDIPCRAGVFLRMDGNQVAEARIGFLDTNLKEKGTETLSLTDRRNPLEYITLPEVIDKLSEKILRSITQNGVRELFIEEITFQGLGISNDFSKQLTGTLKSSLTRMNNGIRIDLLTRGLEPMLKLRGGYATSGNFLKIGVQLINDREQPVGPALLAEILLSNIPNAEIEPDTQLMQEASHAQAITATDDDRPGNGEELVLEVITNKGYGPQSYREGDRMTLKVRANKPCTVRMIYQDASRNLIRLRNDDFAIVPDAVGKWIGLPEQFECAAPFGFELLLAYATEGKFKPIEKTQWQNGFTFILDDLKNVVELTTEQGKKKQIAKSIIPITTQPRRNTFK